jgi:hypothetical protein
MHGRGAELARSRRFGGIRRHACTQSRRLITRRSQVQILPPLLERPWQQGLSHLRATGERIGSRALDSLYVEVLELRRRECGRRPLLPTCRCHVCRSGRRARTTSPARTSAPSAALSNRGRDGSPSLGSSAGRVDPRRRSGTRCSRRRCARSESEEPFADCRPRLSRAQSTHAQRGQVSRVRGPGPVLPLCSRGRHVRMPCSRLNRRMMPAEVVMPAKRADFGGERKQGIRTRDLRRDGSEFSVSRTGRAASVLQASRFRRDVTVFRLNARPRMNNRL